MFARLQKALSLQTKNRVSLKKGVHQALEDFRWLASDLTSRPTRISELVPLLPGAEGQHDASAAGTGGVWFPGNSIPTRGTLKPGGLIHLDCVAQTLDTRERTLLSKGDNQNTTFWERKGSTTTDSAPAYLLRLFGIHQRFHRYVPRFDYIAGPSNPIADSLSRDFHLSMSDLISRLTHLFPQTAGYQVWTPPSKLVSAIISALRRKQSPKEYLLVVPKNPSPTTATGSISPLTWASTPFSKPSRTKYLSYKSSDSEFVTANLHATKIQSSLDRLKITYGQLPRRSLQWGR
eukprot:CCRYP_006083-RD/>CCRYP_006083-RD protein AED:0.24 eAED:0.14 QI:0/0/0/1/0/0/2/0/290